MDATQSQIAHQAGEAAAMRALIGALIATHPAPEKLRQTIASCISTQMTLVDLQPNDLGYEAIKSSFHDTLLAFLDQLPKSSMASA